MYTINFPAIAPSAAHNFSVKTIEFKMAAVSVKKSIAETGYETRQTSKGHVIVVVFRGHVVLTLHKLLYFRAKEKFITIILT